MKRFDLTALLVVAALTAGSLPLAACGGGEEVGLVPPGARVTQSAEGGELEEAVGGEEEEETLVEDEDEEAVGGEEEEEAFEADLDVLDSYLFKSTGEWKDRDRVASCKVEVTSVLASHGGTDKKMVAEETVNGVKEEAGCIVVRMDAWVLEDGEWTEYDRFACERTFEEWVFESAACLGPQNLSDFVPDDPSSLKGTFETVNGTKTVHFSLSKRDIERLWPEDFEDESASGLRDARLDLWIAKDGRYPVRVRGEARAEDEELGEAWSRIEAEVSNVNDESLKVEAP